MDLNVNPASWLNLSRLLEFNGVFFWDHIDLPDIPFSTDDTYVTLTADQAQRIDLVAYDYYGDTRYFWIILQANDVDLPNQFLEGQVIRIPSKDTIDQLLSQNQAV